MNDDRRPQTSSLIDRERIRGASRMIADGTDAARVTAEQVKQVAADVLGFCQGHRISRKDVAKAVGYSPGVVSEFLAGAYKGNNGQVAIDLENWLVEEEPRRAQPETTQFTWTNVAMEIKAVANYALDKRRIALIYGPDTSGVGKTTALQAVSQTLGPRRSTLVTIDKVDANPTGLLKKVCAAMHLGGADSKGTNRARFERIVAKLTGRSHLLIVDQIHNLRAAKDDKPLYILTDLFDATRTAQMWCGTADMITYLRRAQAKGDESLAQVASRIFPIVDLMEGVKPGGGGEPLVTIDQVREMFAKNQLKLTPGAARYLCGICNVPDSGAVRLCVQVVEFATMLADQRRLPTIDLPLIHEALRRGLMVERAEVFMREVEQAIQRVAKAG